MFTISIISLILNTLNTILLSKFHPLYRYFLVQLTIVTFLSTDIKINILNTVLLSISVDNRILYYLKIKIKIKV